MQPAVSSVSICRRCGVVAPAQGTTCEVCRQPLASVRVQSPPQPVDQVWVAVRCGFTCNSCQFLAPLDSLDTDGAVECAHCGLRQRFEVGNWRHALLFAHSVGDLAGPNPEGRNPHPTIWIGSDNPYEKVGSVLTFQHEQSNTLSIDATPGHPVCDKCAEPLHVHLTGPGACQTLCPVCGDRGSYQTTDAMRELYGGILAIVAEDHRSDRPKARSTATGAGVVALSCPSCGAPLQLEGKSSIQTCSYCKTSCIVPHRSLSRALQVAVEPSIWWILMRGISPKRAELLRGDDEKITTGDAARDKLLQQLKAKAAKNKSLGNDPGVYPAPEVVGFNTPQFLFTLALGLIALFIAFVLTRFIPISF
jgi:hypothetical protein